MEIDRGVEELEQELGLAGYARHKLQPLSENTSSRTAIFAKGYIWQTKTRHLQSLLKRYVGRKKRAVISCMACCLHLIRSSLLRYSGRIKIMNYRS